MARASGTNLASRSSFGTTSVSPARTAARAWSWPGRQTAPSAGRSPYGQRRACRDERITERSWLDILRVAATLASGTLPPSQLLRKFAACPRQHELAVTLREIGRVERTLFIRTIFIVDWLLDADMQHRANTGLNQGVAHHALKNTLWIGRQGEIRDRSSEGQDYRMAGLNLLAAIVIYWNTAHLGEAVRPRKHAGLKVEAELLARISPLGWAHSYSPANTRGQSADGDLSVRFCPLPESTRRWPTPFPGKRSASSWRCRYYDFAVKTE